MSNNSKATIENKSQLIQYFTEGIKEKSKQDPNLKKDYTKEFELDWLVGGVLLTGAFINAYLANFYHYIYQALFC